MNINTITTDDLRGMEGKDGLILQGCGGDLKEWVDGINDMFTEAGILKDGSKFEDVSAFQYGELTCLLYPFEDVKLDIGKLAIWRLQTHADFGGTEGFTAGCHISVKMAEAGCSHSFPNPRITVPYMIPLSANIFKVSKARSNNSIFLASTKNTPAP